MSATAPAVAHGGLDPLVRHDAKLQAIDGVAADDVWAVGVRGDGGYRNARPLTLHWDGDRWSTVPSLNAAGVLISVEAVSSSDVWAVGQLYVGGDTDILILHWDGSAWSRIAAPEQPGQYNHLDKVSAVSADDVLAVGEYSSGEEEPRPISLHWDGRRWTQSRAALDGIVQLDAISPRDAWAVGESAQQTTLAKHWDGTRWQRVATPDPDRPDALSLVTAVSSDDVWAAGYTTPSYQGFTEHWDGSRWQVADPDIPTGYHVDSLSGSPDHDVWVSGNQGNEVVLRHWTGDRWHAVESPASQRSEAVVSGIKALSDVDAWAVGSWYLCDGGRYCYYQRILMHWDGTEWTDYRR